MERRNAVIAMLASAVGLMSGGASLAGDKPKDETTETNISIWNQPRTLVFDLSAFESFDFSLGNEKVSLSPAEIMQALKSK